MNSQEDREAYEDLIPETHEVVEFSRQEHRLSYAVYDLEAGGCPLHHGTCRDTFEAREALRSKYIKRATDSVDLFDRDSKERIEVLSFEPDSSADVANDDCDDEPGDIDSDEGFDPYMGMYTGDC